MAFYMYMFYYTHSSKNLSTLTHTVKAFYPSFHSFSADNAMESKNKQSA